MRDWEIVWRSIFPNQDCFLVPHGPLSITGYTPEGFGAIGISLEPQGPDSITSLHWTAGWAVLVCVSRPPEHCLGKDTLPKCNKRVDELHYCFFEFMFFSVNFCVLTEIMSLFSLPLVLFAGQGGLRGQRKILSPWQKRKKWKNLHVCKLFKPHLS